MSSTTSSGEPPTDPLVSALRRAARDLAAKRSIRDLHKTLAEIVLAAVATVPHVDAGGISLAEDGTVTARGPSDETITKLDVLQGELREGPCITAMSDPAEDGVILADDLADDRDGGAAARWPRFAPAAVEAGYRSILSIQLAAEARAVDRTWAALNLYSAEPHVFDVEARQIAGLFGVHAAVLLYGSEQIAHLQHAVDSRDVIGQAKGILMERFTVDDDEAFQMLVRSSQDTNLKLVSVAEWLRREAAERRAERGKPVGDAR